jgi:hypothetical protein
MFATTDPARFSHWGKSNDYKSSLDRFIPQFKNKPVFHTHSKTVHFDPQVRASKFSAEVPQYRQHAFSLSKHVKETVLDDIVDIEPVRIKKV